MQNEKEPEHDICVVPNFHLGGRSYYGSALIRTLHEILTLYAFPTLPSL